MRLAPALILSAVSAVLIAGGVSVYAIEGVVSITSAGLLWVGLLLALFLLYAKFGEIKKTLVRKSARYGANMVVMVAVFFGVLVFMGALGEAHKERIDLTETGRFTLSSQTRKILKNLEKPVKVVAFYRSESGTMHAQFRQRAKDLLEEYASESPNFSYTFIDPDRNPGLASKYGVSEYRIILLMSGGEQVKVGNEKEEKITNGLIKLLQDKKKVIYFIKGHGEKDLTSQQKHGYQAAREAVIGEGYEVKELLLLRHDKIPEDASVVILASPQRPLAKEELERLDDYFRRGGALLVQIDPGHPPTLKTWLENYGFKLQDDVIIDQQSQVYGANYLTPVVYSYNKEHPLTEGFNLATYFAIANSVYIDEDKKKGRYQLAETGPNSWTEVDKDQLESGNAEYDEEREKRGPIPIMAVTTVEAPPVKDEDGAERKRYGKMILVGDSDFANNTNINLAGNGDLFLNTVSWLADEADLVAVRARKENVTPVVLTASQGRAIFWIPVVMVPSAVLMTGVGIYSRRKWFR